MNKIQGTKHFQNVMFEKMASKIGKKYAYQHVDCLKQQNFLNVLVPYIHAGVTPTK